MYLNHANNPGNKGRWVGYARLGYQVRSAVGRAVATRNVIRQIRLELSRLPAIQGKNLYGPRLEVNVPIRSLNGRSGTLQTVWQYDTGSTTPRLITNILKVNRYR